MRKSISPFIIFLDLKNEELNNNNLKKIKGMIDGGVFRQVILMNWESYSMDHIYMIYKMFQKALIKLAFLVNDNSDIKKLDQIICNIYRIYVKDEMLQNISLIDYFNEHKIDIWLIIDYERYKKIDGISFYKKMCVDITKENDEIRYNKKIDMDKVVFFPRYSEEKSVVSFGYETL